MSIRKQVRNGKTYWGYEFDLPGSTREHRQRATAWGFETKKQAGEAEVDRRKQEQDNREAQARGVTMELPRTLKQLLAEFLTLYADKELGPKTAERYREMSRMLSPELCAMPISELSALHLTREWARLRESGGRHRYTKQARSLAPKSVAGIRGVVSSAFRWAGGQGLVARNPTRDSVLPRGGQTRKAVALTCDQQQLIVDASTHWMLPEFLEVSAGLGARRGEVLALRWTDIENGEARICRSLSQSKEHGLVFKDTKSEAGNRYVSIPEVTLAVLERIRQKQAAFRAQFGPDYRRDLDLIFCQPDGSPLNPDSISATVSALCKRLKLPKGVSLHAFRHSHGSQLLVGGIELPTVSRRLGHSSPAMTAKVYSHMLGGRDRAAADVWSQMKSGVSTPPVRHQRETEPKSEEGAKSSSTQNERVRPN
jgi:integrase